MELKVFRESKKMRIIKGMLTTTKAMLTIHSLKLEEAAISMVWLRSNRLRKF